MWEQIAANRRRSALLIALMLGVLLLVGAMTGGVLAGPEGLMLGVVLALIVFGVQWLVYATAAESVLLTGTHAREISRDDSPQLFNVVEEMKIAAGLTHFPRIYIIDDPSPNAFAIGRKPDRCAVAVTTGLMHRLNRDELQGVIAHEIAHIKNQDVHFMTLAGVMLGSVVLLSHVLLRVVQFGGRGRSRSSSRGGGGQAQLVLLLVALLLAILGPLLAQLLYFACSRKREYLADACGAQYTRYPEGLASALEKISLARIPVTCANKVNAPLFIVNPLAASGSSTSLFATHPPTVERIRILRSMAGASLADYEQAYRRNTGHGLLGAGSLRDTASQPIREASPAGPVETRQAVHNLKYRHHGYIALTCNCGLEIGVPPGYERATIRCVRCASELPIPAAAPPVLPASKPSAAPAEVLQYKRLARGKPAWESFRCACGRPIQLSPAFSAPRVRCAHCQRTIEVV